MSVERLGESEEGAACSAVCACPLRSERRARTSITAGVRRVTVVVAVKARGWSVAVVGTVTDSSEEQSAKANSSISVTDGGMETCWSAEHSAKAHAPIAVTDGGMETCWSAEQPSKAQSAIAVTDAGMSTASSEAQLSKALSSIAVTDEGMPTLFSALQPSQVPSQCQKASSGTLVMPAGSSQCPFASMVTS